MSQPIRAIYRSGRLYLLDKVDLREGQIYSIMVTPLDEEIDSDEILTTGNDKASEA